MNKHWRNVLIVSILLLLLVGPSFALVPDFLVSRFEVDTAIFWQMVSFLVALLLVLLATVAIIRSQKIDLKRIGLFVPTPWYALVAAVVIGLYWAYSTTFSLTAMDPDVDIMGMWLTFNPLRFFLILVGPVGAMIEDFITRGFVMSELNQAKVPTWLQLVFSSFLFAFYHSIWMVPIIGIYFLYSLAASFGYGLLLGGLYLLGKRSLTPVMLSHGLTVLLGEPILTYTLIKTFLM